MGSTGVSARATDTNATATTAATVNVTATQINRTGYTDEGFGRWTLDFEGLGGVSILDERDTSRAGFGSGPAYSVHVYDNEGTTVTNQLMYGSLTSAKQEGKTILKELLSGSK